MNWRVHRYWWRLPYFWYDAWWDKRIADTRFENWPLWDWIDCLLVSILPRLLVCRWVGHRPMNDHCGMPEHRLCSRCAKPTPHAEVIPGVGAQV